MNVCRRSMLLAFLASLQLVPLGAQGPGVRSPAELTDDEKENFLL